MHALVIGGTGMLRGLCLALSKRADSVSVVARRRAALAALTAEGRPGSIHAIPADYTDWPDLAAQLRAAVIARGAVTVATIWVHHDQAPDAPRAIAEFLADAARPVRLFHILGSTSMLRDQDDRLATISGILYRRVLLGSVADAGVRRWLTDEEICSGVLHAIDADVPLTLVGDRRPWPGPP